MIETMTEMMTETMKEKMTGLQVPESFVSVTGSGSVRLHLPAFPDPMTVTDDRDDRCWERDGQEVDPRGTGGESQINRKSVPGGQEVGPLQEVGLSWTINRFQDGHKWFPEC